MNQIYLIGTDHRYQNGIWAGFEPYLTELCRSLRIRALAEEMSREALDEWNVDATVCERVSAALTLSHHFCDPDQSARRALGIGNIGLLRAVGLLSEMPPCEIERRVRREACKRERFWLEQLRAVASTPLLFVCGANHVAAFDALLQENGYRVEILSRRWAPGREPSPPGH